MVESKQGENEKFTLLLPCWIFIQNQFLMLSGIVCPREAKSLPICEPVSYGKLGKSVVVVIIIIIFFF